MPSSMMQLLTPTLIAGAFAIITSIITSRLAIASERKRFERDMQAQKEVWRREFAVKYAEAAAEKNQQLAERLQQQFAGAFLYIRNPELGVSDRRFIPNGANMVLGSAPDCDIVLPNVGGSVTSRHAIIEIIADETWVRDLSSTNGTFVNERKVTKRAQLQDGETLRFGSCAALFKRLS